MKTWEYRTVTHMGSIPNCLQTLNMMGSEGWELVTLEMGVAYLKREIKK